MLGDIKLDAGANDLNRVPRINHHFRLQWEPAQDAFVLLYPEGMVKLNQSAGEILARCDGSNSIADIIRQLCEKFPAAEDIEADVLEFCDDASQRRWLV